MKTITKINLAIAAILASAVPGSQAKDIQSLQSNTALLEDFNKSRQELRAKISMGVVSLTCGRGTHG